MVVVVLNLKWGFLDFVSLLFFHIPCFGFFFPSSFNNVTGLFVMVRL